MVFVLLDLLILFLSHSSQSPNRRMLRVRMMSGGDVAALPLEELGDALGLTEQPDRPATRRLDTQDTKLHPKPFTMACFRDQGGVFQGLAR